ncbi:sensor histidine kinase [Cyclobacteriaceae bacterium YHN15]|nr:sensor histidine kinase [Cyclobacteriaceae bacterium YHN15]
MKSESQLKAEIERLQRSVDKQALELDSKNRELEVEAALERVRAMTMAMHSSDDVGKCVVKMFAELTALGVDEGTRFGIGILNHDNENNQLWTARKNGEEVNMHIGNIDMASHPLLKSARKAWKEQVPLHKYVLEGEDLLNYYQMLNNAPDYKIQIPIEKLPKKEIQHCFIFEHGFFYAFSPREFQPDLIHITKRFSSLFEQTYRRYLDLVRAETQAREAEIELALERVRARTMAMHHTEELKEVIQVVFDQFVGLKIHVDHAGFILDYKEREDMHIWLADHQQGVPTEITIPYFDSPHWNSYNEAKAKQESFFANLLPFEVKNKFYQDLFELIPELTEEAQQAIFGKPALAISTVLLDNVGLYIEHYSMTPYTDEENAVLMRFGKVFQQTYTRFLDLQKAEVQAREARIETALERVRSRSMAMHKTDELQEVVRVVAEELKHTGVILDTWGAVICTYFQDSKDVLHWTASEDPANPSIAFLLPYFKDELFDEAWESKERGDSYFAKVFSFEVKNAFFNHAFEHSDYRQLPDDYKKLILESENHGIAWAWAKNSAIMIPSIQGDLPSEDEKEILIRFAKVFEQSFIRFLDLQKAEAQAREAQIEAALERVRSKTMGMQRSEQLGETASLLFKQFDNLGIHVWSSGFQIWNADNISSTAWMSSAGGEIQSTGLRLPHTEDPYFINIYNARHNPDRFFVMESKGKELEDTYRYMFNIPEWKKAFGDIEASGFPIPKYQITHSVYFTHGYLMLITHESYPEYWDIFKRFGKVFDQTYTRFLDLQKAEAQAREAQIEAALEKVRSRSLAMHKSGELNEVVSVLFERLKDLQIPFTAVGIATNIEGSKDLNAFVCGQNEAGLVITNYRLPYFDNPVPKDLYSAIEKQLDYFVGHYSKEEKDAFYNYVIEHTDEFRHLPEDIKRMIFDSTTYTISMVAVKNAVFNVNDFEGKVLAESEIDIIKRFARVFDQAYIRFLDLQKAEAQAREAQIEAGLERVRSKSLAMHKTAELQSVIHTVHQELLNLNISISGGSFIVINNEIDNEIQCWGSGGTADTSDRVHIPHFEKQFYTHLLNGIKNGPGFFTEEYTQEEKIEFFTFLFHHEPWSKLSAKEKKNTLSAPGGYTRSCAVAKHTSIFIINHFGERFSEAENAILIRFGKVFEQSYTRFLDLQKAEAQAREAQIELSLERIRSQVTAMQESSDLLDIVVTMRTEFVKLGHEAHYFWHMRWLPERYDKAMTSGDGTKIGMVMTLPRHIHGDIQLVADWEKTKEPTVVLAMEVETAVDYVHKMITLGDFEQVDPQAPTLDDIRHIGGLTFVMARTTHGEIGYSLPGVVTNPPKNAVDTLIRFAGVFDLAYKRFEDLKSAERQHREAQIELALERVRARTMAMQKSEELADAAFVLFEQLRALGGNLWGTGFGLCQEHVGKDEFWFANENGVFPPVAIPNTTDPAHKQMYQGWLKKTDFLSIEKAGAALRSHYDYMLSLPEVRLFFQKIIDEGLSFPEKQQWNAAYFSKGYLLIITLEPYPEPEIFKRFAKVFEQTYTRFLDLQKAEKQARESEIQLALERVRARTMAMQKSDELRETIGIIFEQLVKLGFDVRQCSVSLIDHEKREIESFQSAEVLSVLPQSIKTPFIEGPLFDKLVKGGFFNKSGYTVNILEGEDKVAFDDYIFQYTPFQFAPEEVAVFMRSVNKLIICRAHMSFGFVEIVTNDEPISAEEADILQRLSQVFEQTYIRFLDLQKAEAQAREAQIEAALERVRSRSMAMRKSEELADLSLELVKQVQALGVATWFCAFNIYMEDGSGSLEWGSNGEGTFPRYVTPREGIFLRYYEAGQQGESLLVNEIGANECPAHYDYLCSLPGVGDQLLKMKEAGIPFPTAQIDHVAYFKYGYLLFITYEPTPESHDIFKRFAKVFEQTYTRFLDLQKAEAQAREAKVEAALEKVRSRTMGMQSSDELQEVANIMFLEIQTLNIPAWSCGYNILSADKKVATNFMSNEGTIQKPFDLPLTKENSLIEFYQFLQSEESFFTQVLDGKALESHYNFMKSLPELTPVFNGLEEAGIALPTYQINHLCKFTHGYLLFITYKPVQDAHDIFKRFTKVFDQTYTRFLDLQKAEKQAREAQIENALEKVRSRSLAMQSPDELIEVAQLLREEMGALGVEELETSSIYIQDESSGLTQCWFTIKNPDNPGKAITDQMVIDLQDTWVGRKMDEFYRSKAKQTSILMQGKERIEWIRYCEEKSDLFGTSNFYGETIPDRTYHLYKFSNGYIGAAAPGEISSESWELLKRATTVFSFAYTRFRDLQMAQASARTAMRQASLDRVRAEISSMRHVNDLDRITPLIFKELTVLGVPFIRCGVFIIQEKQKIVEAYLSSPEGNSLGVLRLPYKASELTFQTVEAWRKGEVYRQHWNKEDFIQWINQLMKEDQIQDSSTYQGSAAPPESLDLHFVPFAQGMLYVGAVSPLDEKELELVQTLAKAFSIAYARFEDFVKLEQAKAEVESAMSELKATQYQLVQQEKLASLGQLTAGIAHEIKNPLNFVNNFSEVSLELLDEIKETRNKSQETRPKTEEDEIEEEILEDIKGNLKKIHEHGTRANGIVTSMLQHSRGGSGKMEPTDLNALIKEYVNLSFHGMRAGKNPINVEIALDLDPDLGMVSLIKEDFTRVVINLCNNAFDAMREKVLKTQDARHKIQDSGINTVTIGEGLDSNQKGNGKYQPCLKVSTKIENMKVRISLEDNGPGIPDEIKDKIMQPFFTTKKGTEGTGLGLSITHDIIKAHGGELKVESKEGEGSEFIIQLPKQEFI